MENRVNLQTISHLKEAFIQHQRESRLFAHSCVHSQMSHQRLNFNVNIYIVSPLRVQLVSPCITFVPSITLFCVPLCLTLFIPLFSLCVSLSQMSAHQLRSDGREEQTGWVFIERAHTQTPTQTRTLAHTQQCLTVTCCSRDSGLLSSSL